MTTSRGQWVDDPADRPVTRRAGVRLLVLDPDDRVLLLHDSDPGVPGAHWWGTPGGGIDAGESPQAAAVRELAEETGLMVGPDDLVGPVARRWVRHGYSDRVLEQDEAFFGVRRPHAPAGAPALTAGETATLLGERWWSAAELSLTDDWLWPAELPDLCLLAARALRGEPMELRDLGRQEESTRA